MRDSGKSLYSDTGDAPAPGEITLFPEIGNVIDCGPRLIFRRYRAMHRITKQVAERHGLSLDALVSDSLKRHVAHARQEAMYRIYNETNHSMSAISRFFKRDHTTVGYSIRKFQQVIHEKI